MAALNKTSSYLIFVLMIAFHFLTVMYLLALPNVLFFFTCTPVCVSNNVLISFQQRSQAHHGVYDSTTNVVRAVMTFTRQAPQTDPDLYIEMVKVHYSFKSVIVLLIIITPRFLIGFNMLAFRNHKW